MKKLINVKSFSRSVIVLFFSFFEHFKTIFIHVLYIFSLIFYFSFSLDNILPHIR